MGAWTWEQAAWLSTPCAWLTENHVSEHVPADNMGALDVAKGGSTDDVDGRVATWYGLHLHAIF